MNTSPNIPADIKAITAITAIPVILDVICRTTGMGFATIARVTEDRWVLCAVLDKVNFGLKIGSELSIGTTLCDEVRELKEEVAVDDFDHDKKYRGHQQSVVYGLRSYISVPIWLKGGRFFGTLCAVDANPAMVNNPETIGMFNLYAELISLHIDNYEQLEIARTDLSREKEMTILREQFITIWGHDLRDPVSAIKNVAKLMQNGLLDENGIRRFSGVLLSSHDRMVGMINDLTCQARAGSCICITPTVEQMEEPLRQMVDELHLIWPDRVIHLDTDLGYPVYCDSKRVSQLFSNLLSNALIHGAPEGDISIKALSSADKFELCVQNTGKPIPADIMVNIFKPFAKGQKKTDEGGLGLGLYIASEIAHAHGGKLEVCSNDQMTIFTFSTPNNIYQ